MSTSTVSDSYHRIDIRQTSQHLVVRSCDRVAADSRRALVLYESGVRSRRYVCASTSTNRSHPVRGQTTSRCTRSCTPGCDGRVPLPTVRGS